MTTPPHVPDDVAAANDALNRVVATFLSTGSTKRPRAKPHRCHDCGKVTKHVRCAECSRRRRAVSK